MRNLAERFNDMIAEPLPVDPERVMTLVLTVFHVSINKNKQIKKQSSTKTTPSISSCLGGAR